MRRAGVRGAGGGRRFESVLGWLTRNRRRPDRMTAEQVFWLAQADLPRTAPGSPATTRLLLRLAGRLRDRPLVLDIGCGVGPASLVLAADTGGTVLAVDTHEPFLARLRMTADAAGLRDRIVTVAASMRALPVPDASVDLIWAEGSAYLMGFDEALAGWRRLLAPGGVLVLTEAEWTTPHPAGDARTFWAKGNPGMRATDGNVRAALAAGWTVHATYLLPEADWAAYYGPLAERIEQLRERGFDPQLLHEVGGWEIDIRRRHGTDYGYTGYVLRPR